MLDYNQLKDILPQAYPFLMIDRVEEIKKGESLVAIKNITGNEWPCLGYSCDSDIFPETLLIEAAAQAALVLYHVSKVGEGEKRPSYVLGKVKAEFFDTVGMGEQIKLCALGNKMLYTGGYSDVEIFVNDIKKANVEVIYSVEREK